MVVTTIISFTTSAPTDDTISELNKVFNASSSRSQFTIGTKVQNPTVVQITAEWPSAQAPSELSTNQAYQDFSNTIQGIASSPITTTVVNLSTSIFTPRQPPLTEFVHCSFPASTPDFKSKIESDFTRFESIFRRRGNPEACGEMGLATGWAEEVNGVAAFVVVRGWREMRRFEESLSSEEFREGGPILMGWGVPFELWHVETKGSGGF
ncbi:hypothetical protein SLS61_009522 [Didymella pomorum]